jgi:hypothetical protein
MERTRDDFDDGLVGIVTDPKTQARYPICGSLQRLALDGKAGEWWGRNRQRFSIWIERHI